MPAAQVVPLVSLAYGDAGLVQLFTLISMHALVLLTLLLGAHKVEVDPNFPDNTPYIGLDWFILDLLGSTLIFVFIEKLFALRRDQPVFRPEWQTDLHHFIVNHMVVGFRLGQLVGQDPDGVETEGRVLGCDAFDGAEDASRVQRHVRKPTIISFSSRTRPRPAQRPSKFPISPCAPPSRYGSACGLCAPRRAA